MNRSTLVSRKDESYFLPFYQFAPIKLRKAKHEFPNAGLRYKMKDA